MTHQQSPVEFHGRAMLGYISRRLFALLPVLIVVSIVIFSIAHLTPGDPATGILGPEASAEDLARLRESMGLNEPVLSQYFTWVGSVLTGDFGDSIFLHMPVLHRWPQMYGRNPHDS